MDVPRTEAVGLLEGSVRVAGSAGFSPLAWSQASLLASTVKTVPKTSRRSVFCCWVFSFCFVWGLIFLTLDAS